MKILRNIIWFIQAMIFVLLVRYGWYKYRRKLGYPISLWRAFFGRYPRFGSFEYDEPGCPDHDKRDYEMVMDAKDL